jgi:pyruvoyl-dependent arginine decarboxylase (PvlArgDC)
MKTHVLKGASLVAAASLLTAGCSNLTPSQNAAMFGAAGGALAGGIGSAAGMNTGQAIATGLAAGAAVATVTYVIAKHQATERQRQIAEERARRAYAQMSTERKSELKARKTRYIAVDTERDEHSSPQAKKSVMIWDTQSQEVVGNDVYDLKSSPAVGSTAQFDTYSAEYVGSGG